MKRRRTGVIREGVFHRCGWSSTPKGAVPECIGRAVGSACTCPNWTQEQIDTLAFEGASISDREQAVASLRKRGWDYRRAMRFIYPEDRRFHGDEPTARPRPHLVLVK